MGIITSNLSLVSWIIFGALAGWVANLLTGGKSRLGCLGSIVVGVIGAFLGGWVYSMLTGRVLVVGWDWTAFLVAVLGAVVLLVILNLFSGKK